MIMHNKYFDEFVELAKELDETVQVEIRNTLIQSVNDLNLENAEYSEIVNELGTPSDFMSDYILELKRSKKISIRSYPSEDNRLLNSYRLMGMLQVLVILLTINPLWSISTATDPRVFRWTLLTSAYILITLLLVYVLSSIMVKFKINIANIYYNSFQVMIIFLLANLVTDDYINSIHYLISELGLHYEYRPFYIGNLILWQIPVTIVTALELRVLFEKSKLVESKDFISSITKNLHVMKKIILAISFIIMYSFPNMPVLIPIISIILGFLVLEWYLLNKHNETYNKKKIITSISILIFYIILWIGLKNYEEQYFW